MRTRLIAKYGLWIVFCLNFSTYAFAQTISVNQITVPLAPGERMLSFQLNGINNSDFQSLDVYTFYSTNPSLLNVLDLNGNVSYGKVVLRNTGNGIFSSFVFPHLSQPIPNRRYFEVLTARNTSGLQNNFMQGRINWRPEVYEKGECVYYRILVRRNNQTLFTSERGKFRMPDSYNIGLAGDSYGSGEGAPDVEDNLNPQWAFEPCHRSNQSGLVKGLRMFISNHPEIAVDYVHAACSGARTVHLGQFNQQPDWNFVGAGPQTVPLQFQAITDELIQLRDHDQVNLLIMSIGGNDVGFGDVVINYFMMPQNMQEANLSSDGEVLADIQNSLNTLGTNYDNLDQEIVSDLGDIKPRVGICTYPDPTNGPKGRCGFPDNPFSLASLKYIDPAYLDPKESWCLLESDMWNQPQSEYEFLSNQFIRPLNNRIREKAGELNWNIIEVEDRMGENGLCNCTEPYINTLLASMAIQGHVWGVAHPNRAGYDAIYKEPVYDFIAGSVEQFRANYAMALLLGIKTIEECPENEFTLLPMYGELIALRGLLQNTFIRKNKISLGRYLRDKDIRMSIRKDDPKSLTKNRSYMALKSSIQKQERSNINRSVTKQKKAPKTIKAVKTTRFVAVNHKEADQLLRSKAFDEQMNKAKQLLEKYQKKAPNQRSKKPVIKRRPVKKTSTKSSKTGLRN